MASVLQIASPEAVRRIHRVQTVTIAWMSVEAVVSFFAAWRARSPALLAFGGDSTIELFSAVVVLWRFRASAAHEEAERRAATEFQKIIDHRGVVANFPLGVLARLQLGRAYELGGDVEKAREAYAAFLVVWLHADSDIPILKQAKAEYAKLK